jgi:hypothetical protein
MYSDMVGSLSVAPGLLDSSRYLQVLAVSELSSFVSSPGESHMLAVEHLKRLLLYLRTGPVPERCRRLTYGVRQIVGQRTNQTSYGDMSAQIASEQDVKMLAAQHQDSSSGSG